MPSGPSWFWFASRWQKWLWKRTKLLRDDIQWDIIFGLSCIKASLRTWMHIWEFGGAKNHGHRSAEMWTEVIWSGESSCTPQEVKHICGVQQEDKTGLNAGPPQWGDLGTLLSCLPPWLHPRDYQQAWPLSNPLSKEPFSPTSHYFLQCKDGNVPACLSKTEA